MEMNDNHNNDDNDEFITESILGTKNYWNKFYDEELNNFNEYGDTGETWFGTKITMKIIDWVDKNHDKNDYICDIGCGNGYLLEKLNEKNFHNLYGYDYSEKAIEFCNKKYNNNIHFDIVDILNDNHNDNKLKNDKKFSLIIDKGTYDAICLMPETNLNENRKKYLKFLKNNLNYNGNFLLITCNFTKDEIFKFISKTNFQFLYEFNTPTLSFGGNVGKQITGLIFKLNINDE